MGTAADSAEALDLTAVALRFDDREVAIADLVLLALAEGVWQALGERLSRGLALEREHGRGVDGARVTERLKRFRYARRLISGKDLREWLAARRLAMGDLRRHCLRRVLLDEHGLAGDRVPASGLAGDLRAEALCSGTLASAASRAGDLAAMASAVDGVPEASPEQVAELVAEARAHVSSGLTGLDDLEERAAGVVSLLGAERAFVAGTAAPGDVRRCLTQHRIDWLRVACRELAVASEGAAREALLCLRLDGVPLERLAEDLGATVRPRAFYLADLDPARASALTAVAVGAPAGPFADGDGWVVLVVDDRVPPQADDPELVGRATAELVRDACERLKAGRIRELAAL